MMPEQSRRRILNNTTTASDPGRVRVSPAKLRLLRPDLYGVRGFLRRFQSGFPERTYIEEQLEHGDSRAAVVVCTSPLLVAAYTDELDCIAMLRFPDTFREKYDLSVGSRLLTVNTYGRGQVYDEDLILGPNQSERWTGFHPIIADFISDDNERIDARKAAISEAEWNRTRDLGSSYLASRPGIARDGRPVHASIPAKVIDE